MDRDSGKAGEEMTKDFWKRVKKLEELAGKATQGEWSVDDTGYVFRKPQASSEEEKMPLVPMCRSMKQFDESRFDGAFIAAANPAMILEMIAELRRLEKEADWLACQLEKKKHGCEWCEERYECIPSQVSCGYEGPDNWREAAREAVSEADNA